MSHSPSRWARKRDSGRCRLYSAEDWKLHQGTCRTRGQQRTAIYWGWTDASPNWFLYLTGRSAWWAREETVLVLPRSSTWCPTAQLLVAVLEKKMVWIHRMTSWLKNWLNCHAERTIVSSSKPSFSQILYVSLSYSSELILRSILFNILISGLHDEGKYTFSMSLDRTTAFTLKDCLPLKRFLTD